MSNPATNPKAFPYEEFSIQPLIDNRYLLQSPWLSLEITVDSEPRVHECLQAFARKDWTQVNTGIFSDFLENLKLPFFYLLPQLPAAGTKDLHQIEDSARNLPQQITKNEFRRFLNLRPVPESQNEWNWDSQAILDFSRLDQQRVSPSSLLSIVRRFHLLDCAENDQTGQLYDLCRTTQIPFVRDLRESLATIVFQNYYVTSKCQESLAPALEKAQSASEDLIDFMQDEEGHDLLLLRALTSMSEDPKKLFLAPSTKNIMSLLEISGKLSFLAFCLAIDFFEKPSFGETDPLAELLRFHQQTIAADCLQKHKDINDGGHHDDVALGFLRFMKPVSGNDALFAIRFAEILTDEMTSVTRELIEFLMNKPSKQA